jgi:hypothetical protein
VASTVTLMHGPAFVNKPRLCPEPLTDHSARPVRGSGVVNHYGSVV